VLFFFMWRSVTSTSLNRVVWWLPKPERREEEGERRGGDVQSNDGTFR